MRWEKNRRRLRLWKSALALNKVSEVESTGFWAWRAWLTARSEPLQVWITDAGSDEWVEVIIEGPEGLPGLKLRRQLLKLWKREIEIGDEAFDKAFLVEGSARSAGALLDATLRGQLLRANADCTSLQLGGGQLRVEVSEKVLARVLRVLFKIVRQLAEPVEDAVHQIAHNARRDREAGVRLFNLLLLAREHPDHPETLEALRTASSDPSPKVRVRMAIEMGQATEPSLLKALQSEESDLRVAAAAALGRVGSVAAVQSLKESAERFWLDPGLRQAARQAIAEIQSRLPGASPGQLTLAGTAEAGKLSLAADPAGQLSLPPETRG
jgi:hypothetical protein